MKIIFFLALSILSTIAYCSPMESYFKLSGNSIPGKKGVLNFDAGSIYIDNKTLKVVYKNKEFSLLITDTKDKEMMGGVKLVNIELWNSDSKGYIFIATMSNWFTGGTAYGETHSLFVYQITSDSKTAYGKPQVIKLGEIELGSAGKGYDEIGRYLLKRPKYVKEGGNSMLVSELIIYPRFCDYTEFGESCAKGSYYIGLNDHKIHKTQSDAKAWPPSFKCYKRNDNIEYLICKSSHLSILDTIMSKLYKKHISKKLKKEQRKWLKKRNHCEAAPSILSCLLDSYNNRIDELINN